MPIAVEIGVQKLDELDRDANDFSLQATISDRGQRRAGHPSPWLGCVRQRCDHRLPRHGVHQ